MVRATILMCSILALVSANLPSMSAIAGTTSEDVARQAEDAAKTFRNYLIEKQKEAFAYGKTLLEKTDREIDALSAKADEASGDAKDAYRETIDDLKQKRAIAAKKLDELGDASEDSWDAAKKGFAEAYEALYDAYREALTKFN